MALTIWTTQNAVDTTGTGTTDFTHGTVTNTPVAALHCFGNATTNGASSNHMRMSFGVSDGTDDRFASCFAQHNVATSNTGYRRGTAGCVASCFNTGSTEDGVMSHNSFISGGQRLNNDNGFGNAVQCSSLFFDCDNAKVLTATLNATQDVAVNVDPGFAWDCVFFIGCPETVANGDDAEIYVGFFDRTNQGSISFNSVDADAAPGDNALRISSTYVGSEMGLGTGTLDYGIDAVVGTGTSLDLFPRTGGGDTDPVYCLFLGWSTSESVSLVSWDSPTTGGDNDVTSLSFQPQACVHLLSFAAAYDTAEADGDAGSFGCTFETADDQFCVSMQDENATGGNSDTQGLVDAESINVDQDDGTVGYVGTFSTYLSNGWRHNFTTTEGAVNKFISIAFEEADAGGNALPLLGSSSSGGF